MQQQEWFDIDDHGKMWRCSRIFQGIFSRIDEMYIFSCCFELSARGKLLVNQIQLLLYVFWRDGLLTGFLIQVLMSMRSPLQSCLRDIYLCMTACWGERETQNEGCLIPYMVLSLMGGPSWFDDWISFLPNKGPSALYKPNRMVIVVCQITFVKGAIYLMLNSLCTQAESNLDAKWYAYNTHMQTGLPWSKNTSYSSIQSQEEDE